MRLAVVRASAMEGTMKYRVVVFGVKDTSENIINFIREEICAVDLVITISPEVTKKNQVSGYRGLSVLTEKYGIPVHEADTVFDTAYTDFTATAAICPLAEDARP